MIIPARYMKPIDPEARKKLYEHQQKVLKDQKKSALLMPLPI